MLQIGVLRVDFDAAVGFEHSAVLFALGDGHAGFVFLGK